MSSADLVKQLITRLKVLNCDPDPRPDYAAEQVLEAAYLTGAAGAPVSSQQAAEIGPLLKGGLRHIDNCLFSLGYSFDSDRAAYCLRLRSGLQFMLDRFKSFPAGDGETLESVFGYFRDTESIETLDEALNRWKHSCRDSCENVAPSVSDLTQAWKNKAEATQDNFANLLNDRIWDKFDYPSENDNLWKKIAYAVCGPPKSTEQEGKIVTYLQKNHCGYNEQEEKILTYLQKNHCGYNEQEGKIVTYLQENHFGYNEHEKEIVTYLQEKCIKYSRKKYNDVYIAFIFVCVRDKEGKSEAVVPLIRVRCNDSTDVTNAYFIDHTGRVYDKWSDFLKDNTWNGYYICVPSEGKYTTENNAVFYDQRERGKVVKALDRVSSVTNTTASITSLVGLGLALFPPTAPIGGAVLLGSGIVGAPGAAYGFGRSVGSLVDRAQHDQSINPFASAEARGCWLVTAASVLSVGTMASTKLLQSSAQAGNVASRATRAFVTSLHTTSISVAGVGVVNGFMEVVKKDKVTLLDVLQLTNSVFFFTHTLINFQTASGIIKDAQQSKINSMRADLNEHEGQIFDSMLQGSREVTGETKAMHGNAKFIKEMKNITNKSEFFSGFQLRPDGQLHIHEELTMHPKSYVQMSEGQRNEVLELSRKLHNGDITLDTFNSSVFKRYRLKFDRQIAESKQNAGRALGVDNLKNFQLNNENIFADIKPHEVTRLDNVLKISCKGYNEDLIALGKEVAERQGVKSGSEFVAATEYAARQVEARVKELRSANPNPERLRGVKAKDFYQKKAFEEFMNPSELDQLNQKFTKLRNTCDPHNNSGNLRFGNSMDAANHFDKHKFLPKVDSQNNLPPERYFEIAREMTSGDVTDAVWTQDGSALCLTFQSEKYGVVAIRYDNLADGISVIATLMIPTNVDDSNFRLYCLD